jgi:hypothetical protein
VYSVCHAKTNAQSTKPQKKIMAAGYQAENGRLSHNKMRGKDNTALSAAATAAEVITCGSASLRMRQI